MPSYEILWNGEHRGVDDDLLDVTLRVAPKRGLLVTAPSPSTGTRSHSAVILGALPWKPKEAITYTEIMQRSGCTLDQVSSALYTLRKRGAVASLVPPGEVRRRKRQSQRYWRTA